MSRRHARLSAEGHLWFAEDPGSRNGTRLDDAPVTQRQRMRDGGLLRVGSVSLTLRCTAVPGPDADAPGISRRRS